MRYNVSSGQHDFGRVRRHCAAASVLLMGLLVFGGGQARAQSVDQVVLAIESNTDDAVVYVDSTYLGSVKKRFFRVPSTAGEIRLMAPYQASWSLRPVVRRIPDSENSARGSDDTLQVNVPFPYSYRIDSSPFGASVTHLSPGDTSGVRLGLTPLTLVRPDPLAGRLLVVKPGYQSATVDPGSRVWNRHSVSLAALGQVDVSPVAIEQPRRRRWIDALALGVAGSAAAVAVHYKFKADRRYDVYAENGDPELRPAIKRLDVRSGIALGVMQAGLGVFAIRMALR